MEATRRTRTGALLGAIAGPPLTLLCRFSLLPRESELPAGKYAGVWWIVVVLASWVLGVIGVPLLGACVGAGGWVGRTLGRRLANHLIAGGMAAGVLGNIVLIPAPALRKGQAGPFIFLVLVEIGLLVGIHLCFRKGMVPPPA